MVSLNLRLLPKLLQRGIMGGQSKNTYMADDIRKVEMRLIFPKKHWKLTEEGDHFYIDLLNYTFVGTTLMAEVPTPEERISAQELNFQKAKQKLKEAKHTERTASRIYKAAAKLALDQATVNVTRQKKILDEMKAKLKKSKKRKKTPEEIIKKDGKM